MPEVLPDQTTRTPPDRTKVRPQVSVVIPAHNADSVLSTCLESLHRQSASRDLFEVLVVDNGSQDDTLSRARAFATRVVTQGLNIRVLREANPCSYAARNKGASLARGEVLAFLDADCEADPDWLCNALASLDDHRIHLIAGDVQTTTSATPNLFERYDQAKFLQQERSVLEKNAAATANLWIRKDVFETMGGFDPSLDSGGDEDFCQRSVATGFRLDFSRDARTFHPARATFQSLSSKNIRIGMGCAQRFLQGRFPLPSLLRIVAVFLPRKRFLLELLFAVPPNSRFLLLRLFLLDWLLKAWCTWGLIRGLLGDRLRPRGHSM